MKTKIAKDLLKIQAVFLRPDEPFTWASGIKSPIYCDNRLTLSDYLDQLEQLQKMGDLSQIASMLPGNLGKSFDASQIDEKQMAHSKAIIQSMTVKERENPQILNASRKRRIAAGCGLEVVDVNRLLKQFEMMQAMTKQFAGGKMPKSMRRLMGKKGGKGMLGGKMPGLPF